MPVRGGIGPSPSYCALSTPRISYSGLKTAICAWPVAVLARSRCAEDPCSGSGVPAGTCGGWCTGRVLYRVVPTQPVHWYCQGPTNGILARFCVHQGTPAPVGPPHTLAPRTQ